MYSWLLNKSYSGMFTIVRTPYTTMYRASAMIGYQLLDFNFFHTNRLKGDQNTIFPSRPERIMAKLQEINIAKNSCARTFQPLFWRFYQFVVMVTFKPDSSTKMLKLWYAKNGICSCYWTLWL